MNPEEIKNIVEAVLDQKYNWWPIVLLILISGIAIYFRSYIAKKGRNTATKEDIAEITTKVEQVKHEYLSKLESIKTVLNTRLFIHQVRYQNEFNMLVSLSEKLTNFHMAVTNFELQASPSKSDVKELLSVMGLLIDEYEAHKPFYPQEIYESVCEFHKSGYIKIVLQLDKKNLIENSTASNNYIQKLKITNQEYDAKQMSEAIEKIYTTIRKRIQYWEKLHIEDN